MKVLVFSLVLIGVLVQQVLLEPVAKHSKHHKRNKDCGENAEHKQCKSNCPKTCDNRFSNEETACTLQCVSGCDCKEGFILKSEKSEECVAEDTCKEPKCGENMVFNQCGSSCPRNCENRFSSDEEPCTKQCVPGCVCKEGFIFQDKKSKVCVAEDTCKKPVCGENEEYKECISNCPKNCDNVNSTEEQPCTLQCVPGCDCKEGFIFQSEKTRECVAKDSCKKSDCKKNEVFEQCPSNCQKACNRPEVENCNKGCAERKCVCAEGYVQTSTRDSTCIKQSECQVN